MGEKERGSIEPLLNTPLKDWQIYLGKLLSSTVPPLLSSYVGMAVYLIGLYISRVTIPDIQVLIQLVALTTVQAVVMVAGAVIVSTQTTSVRAANLLASFIVIPSALLIQGESIVIFWSDYQTLWWAVLGMVIFGIVLVRVGLAHFRREELLGREIDVLNIKWGWKVFTNRFFDGARNLAGWYSSLYKLVLANWMPTLIVTLIFIVAIIIGYQQSFVFKFGLNAKNLIGNDEVVSALKNIPGSSLSITSFIWQNLRVLLLSLPLGFFSFGVIGVLPGFASFAITVYLMGIISQAGLEPMAYFTALILPHGIFEIPAAILATAAVLKMGALMATPDPEKSVSEVMLQSLAEWVKIFLGIIVPLIIIAGFVEVWITPQAAQFLMKSSRGICRN